MPDPLEVQFYEAVASEIEEGLYDKGLMAMATAKSLGDKGVARSLYIELRVEQMRAEATRVCDAEERKNWAARRDQRWDAAGLVLLVVFVVFVVLMFLVFGP